MTKTPMRMCIACRTMRPKETLVRIVASEDGVALDPTYKAQRRGCYLCPDPACLAKAVKIKALERTFHKQVDPSFYQQLAEYVSEH